MQVRANVAQREKDSVHRGAISPEADGTLPDLTPGQVMEGELERGQHILARRV